MAVRCPSDETDESFVGGGVVIVVPGIHPRPFERIPKNALRSSREQQVQLRVQSDSVTVRLFHYMRSFIVS
jgi:hypothetical protein